MLQRRGGLDLHHEALGADDGGELGLQDLERHLAVVLEVLGQVDGGHAPLAQLPLDAVAVGEGGDQSVGGGVHFVAFSSFSSSTRQLKITSNSPASVPPEVIIRNRLPSGWTS